MVSVMKASNLAASHSSEESKTLHRVIRVNSVAGFQRNGYFRSSYSLLVSTDRQSYRRQAE